MPRRCDPCPGNTNASMTDSHPRARRCSLRDYEAFSTTKLSDVVRGSRRREPSRLELIARELHRHEPLQQADTDNDPQLVLEAKHRAFQAAQGTGTNPHLVAHVHNRMRI